MKNQSPPTARENWKLGTWLCGRHETSLTCFHSILFFFYEMQGYFASRKLLLLLNLLRKLGNLSAKMATANIQGCQRYYFVILSSINKLKKKILGSRMAIMNFGLQGRKVDGGCVFPWACPDRPQNFLEKKKKAMISDSYYHEWCHSENSLNLTLQISLDDLGLRVRIKWLFSLFLLG